MEIIANSIITCPNCGYQKKETAVCIVAMVLWNAHLSSRIEVVVIDVKHVRYWGVYLWRYPLRSIQWNFVNLIVLLHEAINNMRSKCRIALLVCMSISSLVAGQETKKLDSIVIYSYASSRDSLPYWKIENEYTNQGFMAAHSIYLWDGMEQAWTPHYFPCEECWPMSGRHEYRYDQQGHTIWKGFLSPAQNRKWYLHSQAEFSYDASGNREA